MNSDARLRQPRDGQMKCGSQSADISMIHRRYRPPAVAFLVRMSASCSAHELCEEWARRWLTGQAISSCLYGFSAQYPSSAPCFDGSSARACGSDACIYSASRVEASDFRAIREYARSVPDIRSGFGEPGRISACRCGGPTNMALSLISPFASSDRRSSNCCVCHRTELEVALA